TWTACSPPGRARRWKPTWRVAPGVARRWPSCVRLSRERQPCRRRSNRVGISGRRSNRASCNVQRGTCNGCGGAVPWRRQRCSSSRWASTVFYRPRPVQADFDRATNELSLILAAQRGGLRPETVALVARNLAVIDAAIAESRAALARDPANAELQHLWAAAARQKVELLRWATRVAAS